MNLKAFFSSIIDKALRLMPGGIYGIFSVVFALIGDLIAYLLFPGYSMFLLTISDLGIGPGGFFFNLGIILSGISALPFLVHVGRILNEEKTFEKIRKFAVNTSIVSSISLALIGFFPVYRENLIIVVIHFSLAVITFVGGFLYCTLFGFLIFKGQYLPKILAYLSFLVSGIFILFFIILTPFMEWIAMFGIMTWTLVMSSYSLYKKY